MINDEWVDWLSDRKCKEFIGFLDKQVDGIEEEIMSLSEAKSLSKDFFFRKGYREGILEVLALIKELKQDNKEY